MKFDIEIEGAKELIAKFQLVEHGLVDLRQLGTWDWVAAEFYKIEREQFAAEGAGKTGKWKPLSQPYATRKAKKYGSMPILQASGKLYRSLTAAGASGAVLEKKAQEMAIGTSIPYAGYHQGSTKAPERRGGRRGVGGMIGPVRNAMGPHRGGMPARPPIDFTPEQEKRLLKPIETKLRQLIANAKLQEVRGF